MSHVKVLALRLKSQVWFRVLPHMSQRQTPVFAQSGAWSCAICSLE